jgi:hypothetical protein
MPAAASSKIVSGSVVAGPSVQTIFVRRIVGRGTVGAIVFHVSVREKLDMLVTFLVWLRFERRSGRRGSRPGFP